MDDRAPDPTPIFAALVAERTRPPGRHHWREPWPVEPDPDPPTEEVPVGRHGDDDADGTANQVDEDWRPEVPPPVTPVGPDDPEHPAYLRTGDHEPPRWPEPPADALHALHEAACDVDPAWLALVAQPIAQDAQ